MLLLGVCGVADGLHAATLHVYQPSGAEKFIRVKDHRITEQPGLRRTTMLIQFQLPATCRGSNQQTRLPRATSSLALNASRDGASTASLGNLFECVTTLWVENFVLISNLNLSFSVQNHSPLSCHYPPS